MRLRGGAAALGARLRGGKLALVYQTRGQGFPARELLAR
jgi:hypothetical protein